MKKPFGCLSRSGLFAALFVLALLLGVGLRWGGRLFSPGPLSAQESEDPVGGVRSHAETGGRCSACHVALWSNETMADRCVLCHADVGAQLRDPNSLHGVVMRSGEMQTCYHCHPEHRGSDAQLTILDPGTFPHQVTGFSLQGHRLMANGLAFACADCHGEDPTGLDLARCGDCHRDLDPGFMQTHESDFGPDCLACHDGLDSYGASFDHNQTAFALAGLHASVACAECHQAARAIADLKGTPQECAACHEADDAHDGQFGADCATCHTADGWDQATFDHSQTAFPLAGRHTDVACQHCHPDNVYQGTRQECAACHETDDAHDGQFGADCATCHTADGWDQATFDHSQTAFPLAGRHTDVACQHCHPDNVYQGTRQECVACHETDDAHDGQLGRDCAACHTSEDWAQATFDHNQSAFPLTGRHIETACQDCHADSVYQGTPQECVACHQDPAFHGGLLGTDCVSCHTTTAWSPARYDRAHAFPLNHGDSGTNPCQTCHPETLSAYTCYGCHEHEPARIQREHLEEGISDFQDCVRCHPTGEEEDEGDD